MVARKPAIVGADSDGRPMTRYSRQVIPGRAHGEDGGDKAAIESMIFGTKKKRGPAAANDGADPDFLPPVEDDEADLLVGRSNPDRRKGEDRRRAPLDRRAAAKKSNDYAPLREPGGYRGADDGKRGPILLVGAMLIVAVFGFVVWNAYREGFKGDEPAEVQTLAESGGFKRPYVDTREPAAPTVAEEAEVLDMLDGGPASSEVRPAAEPTPAAAVTPAPSPVIAKPPEPLKTPQAAAPAPSQPVRAATALTKPAPVSLTPAPAVKPATPPAAKPIVPAAAPAPKPVAAVSPAGAKPAFVAGGAWVAQLASTGSEVGAIEEWGRLSKSWPELLGAAERSIQAADVNGQTRYRLRAGAFASKADAASFCAEVKAKGGNCLPAAK